MVLSPFQLVNPNMPAASAGQLPDLLGMFGTPPLLNSFTPVQTPLMQMLGTPEPIGSESRPYPLGAFPDSGTDQYTPSAQASSIQQLSDVDPGANTTSLTAVQAGPSDIDSTGVTPNAAGVDSSTADSSDGASSSTSGSADAGSGGGDFYSMKSHCSRLNYLA